MVNASLIVADIVRLEHLLEMITLHGCIHVASGQNFIHCIRFSHIDLNLNDSGNNDGAVV